MTVLNLTSEYLYLLFDDSDHIALDKHVFNTEVSLLAWGRLVRTDTFSSGAYPSGILTFFPHSIFDIIAYPSV